jgi:hypothetical protein
VEQLIALACIVGVFWYSRPAFTGRLMLVTLVLVTLFLPVIGWGYTLWAGYGARREREIARNEQYHLDVHLAIERVERQRERDIAFQQDMLLNGTPVEQMNAAALLADWGAPEQANAVAPPPPVLVLHHEADVAYVRSIAGRPVVIEQLPSGRVLTRAERWVVRFEAAGILYVPANLIAGIPAHFVRED